MEGDPNKGGCCGTVPSCPDNSEEKKAPARKASSCNKRSRSRSRRRSTSKCRSRSRKTRSRSKRKSRSCSSMRSRSRSRLRSRSRSRSCSRSRSRSASKKRRKCVKPGPVTNNAYLNFLRYYRRTHCGMSAQELIRRGARKWCSLTDEQKARYKRQACKLAKGQRQKNSSICCPKKK